jgi:hypothetical protein
MPEQIVRRTSVRTVRETQIVDLEVSLGGYLYVTVRNPHQTPLKPECIVALNPLQLAQLREFVDGEAK